METLRILLLDASSSLGLATLLSEMLRSEFASRLHLEHERLATPIDQHVWESMSRRKADIVMVIPGHGELGLLRNSLKYGDHGDGRRAPMVAVVENSEPQEVAQLLKAGVADFITPPLSKGELVPRLLRLLPAPSNGNGHARRNGASAEPDLVGSHPAFVAELEKIPVIAGVESGVLIQGETGTGKELFARAIHRQGPRAKKPFVPVNCGAVPVELAESELFGHERGAFTNAYAAHKGVIAQADGGTLFLDEVTSLSLQGQVKLLRFLQEKEYRPLGSAELRRADVRVISAATTLETEVASGRFRQDLFYRLDVIRIMLPPLRQRREDIPALAEFFIEQKSRRLGRPALGLSDAALERLVRYDWPGNVRELEHVIERVMVFCRGPVIHAEDILLPNLTEGDVTKVPFHDAKARTVARFEQSYIEGLLAANRGNISRAARCAGKNRRAFFELIRKHHIDVDRFRPTSRSRP